MGIRWLWTPARDAGAETAQRHVVDARHSQLVSVAAVTIANGGDNLGVYIPVFAADVRLIPLYAAVFGALTLVSCGAGRLMVDAPIVGSRMRRYGRVALPFVLIALGLWILRRALPLLSG